MNTRTTWILLVLVVIGGLYVWLMEGRIDSTEERRLKLRRALSFDPTAVEKLEIERDGLAVECVKEDGEWRIVDPIKARAENAVVRRLIATLARMQKNATVTRSERRSRGLTAMDYGLVPPESTIRLEGEGFRRLINVGKLSPDGQSLFIAADNAQEDVLSVETNLLAAMPQDLAALRSKTLFDYNIDKVRKIEVKTTEGFISLALDSAADWMIRQPYEARADNRKVERLLDSLLDLRIAKFLRDDTTEKSIYGFDEFASEISLSFAGGMSARELRFGARLPSDKNLAYAGFSEESSVFALPASILETLKQMKAEDLRDRKLISVPIADIKRIAISSKDATIELQRREEGWKMVRPRNWQADGKLVDDLLTTWTSGVVQRFVPASTNNIVEWGLATNCTVFSVSDSMPPKEAADSDRDSDWLDLKIGRQTRDRKSVAVSGDENQWIYIVPRIVKTQIELDPLSYRDRTVLQLELDSIQSVTLKRVGMTQSLARNKDGIFEPDLSDKEFDALTMPQSDRLDALSMLRCREYVASGDFDHARYGLENPSCTLTLGLTGEEGISKTLIVGKPNDDNTVFAMVRGQDVVFLLDRELAGILCSDLYVVVEKPQGPAQ